MSLKSEVSALERDGAVRLEGLLPKPLLRRAAARVRRMHEKGELSGRWVVRSIAGRTTTILPLDGVFKSLATKTTPRLRALLTSQLGEDWALSSVEVVMAESGAARQHLHVDAPLRFGKGRGGDRAGVKGLPAHALALATPLCDVTDENGPTTLWLGSRRAAHGRVLPGERAVAKRFRAVRMTGKLGFSYLYDYRTFHRGEPNDSRDARPLLMMVFARPWFRDPNLADVGSGLRQ